MVLKKSNAEGRVDPRITKVLAVDCRIVELAPSTSISHGMKKWQRFPARTINVSKTGILINSDFEIDVQTKIEMTLNFKVGHEQRQVIMLTEVMRTRRNAYDLYGRWAMGTRILEMDPKEFSLVSEYFLSAE